MTASAVHSDLGSSQRPALPQQDSASVSEIQSLHANDFPINPSYYSMTDNAIVAKLNSHRFKTNRRHSGSKLWMPLKNEHYAVLNISSQKVTGYLDFCFTIWLYWCICILLVIRQIIVHALFYRIRQYIMNLKNNFDAVISNGILVPHCIKAISWFY